MYDQYTAMLYVPLLYLVICTYIFLIKQSLVIHKTLLVILMGVSDLKNAIF